MQVRCGRVVDSRRSLREHDDMRNPVGGDALDQRDRLGTADFIGHGRRRKKDAAAQGQQREQ